MPLYSVTTSLKDDEVIQKANTYFGQELGLERTTNEPCCVSFTGAGGHVTVNTVSNGETRVDVETREWDYQVKKFLNQIG